MTAGKVLSARDRIISTAYELFTRRGIKHVGVDEIIERAGVAKATLYNHFASKEDVVVAFLEERGRRWSDEVIDRQPAARADTPEGQLLATFDVLDEWFHSHDDYEACSFVKVLLEVGGEGRIGQACMVQLDKIRAIVRARAEQADLRNPAEFAWAFNILVKGSIVCAAEGDRDAARRAKSMATWLIEQHRKTRSRRGG